MPPVRRPATTKHRASDTKLAPVSTVQEAKRRAIVEVLIRAAQDALVTHGLDVTVDEVADRAGVSRSTIFRHFATRDELISAAVRSGAADLDTSLPPYAGGDWRPWLREICELIHTLAGQTAQGLWDLTARRDLSPLLSDVVRELHDNRKTRHHQIAATLWDAAGGHGLPPTAIDNVVAAHLSPLFTVTVITDVDANLYNVAELAETCIVTAIATQLTSSTSP